MRAAGKAGWGWGRWACNGGLGEGGGEVLYKRLGSGGEGFQILAQRISAGIERGVRSSRTHFLKTMAPPSRWELFGTAVKQLVLSLCVDFSFVLLLSSPVPRLFGIGRVLPDMIEKQKRHIQKLEQQIEKGLRPALDPQTHL